MSMLVKATGAVFGSIAAVYGSFALYTIASANGEVSQYSQQEKKAQSSLKLWQTNLQKQEQAAVTAEVESKAQETEVTKLQKELQQKEEEADVLRKKLTQATESLAAKLDALSAARKASQELHDKIIAGKTAVEAAAAAHMKALTRKEEQLRAINPLAHPDVRALMGR